MTKRYLGNIITQNPTAPTDNITSTPAPGVWSLSEALFYTKAGLWPNAANAIPRAVFAGGSTGAPNYSSNVMDYVTISSTGNATDFGDLVALNASSNNGNISSTTRGIISGGQEGGIAVNRIQYITIAATGNATDFGELTSTFMEHAGASNATKGLIAAGLAINRSNKIDVITIASAGNASDFGDLTIAANGNTGCGSATRSIFAGGVTTSPTTYQTTMAYVNPSSSGNAADFGDLTVGRQYPGAASNSTRALFSGGYGGSALDTIDYVTISSTGNATDFGNLISVGQAKAGASNSTRAIFGSGTDDGSLSNAIDAVEISSTGNATDFGNLTLARSGCSACSPSHGGLAA